MPILSPSPSNEIPKSAFSIIIFSLSAVRFFSTEGSGWWFGKLPSIFSNKTL